MVGSEGRSERRIDELESGIERLRNQQEMMKRKLKKQQERKLKLEVVYMCMEVKSSLGLASTNDQRIRQRSSTV